MKPPVRKNRFRPIVGVLLACGAAAVLIPVWLVTRPGPEVSKTSSVDALGAAHPGVATRKLREGWQRVTAAPRGAAVSVRATTQPPPMTVPPARNAPTLEQRWGVRVCGARLTMGNAYLDLRYEVVDPEKVSALASANTRAYIWERASGARLFLTTPPKEGGFPPTDNRIAAGKTYFAMVSNKGGVLKSGKTVSLIVADAMATNVTID